jgi:GNAT superfamily N-acetyltransferase
MINMWLVGRPMFQTGRIKEVAKSLVAHGVAARQGLSTKQFDEWHPELDEALKALPEGEICTHDLFRLLMKNRSSARKQTVLVTEKGEPVALAGLRSRGDYWEPVTKWIIPGLPFPMKDGYAGRVLAALGVDVRVAWWRCDSPPPITAYTRGVESSPRYGMRCSEDFEAFWRETGHFKNVRKVRKRCRDFALEVDRKGFAEWTLRNWEERWRPKGLAEMLDLEDRLLALKDLEDRGLYHTLALLDQDKPAASATVIVHQNEVVGQYNYRDPEYDWHGAMTRLIESVFFWAKERGFARVDIGGVQDYKSRWAPEDGERWEFRVCPDYLLLARRAAEVARKLRNKLAVSVGVTRKGSERP